MAGFSQERSHWETRVEIRCGDAMAELAKLPDASVQTSMTSPPYFGLRDYQCEGQMGSEATLAAYLAGMVAVFREVRRVLRKDGTLWLNMGDAYAQGGQRATTAELAGDRVRAAERGYATAAYAGYPGWQRAAGTAGGSAKVKDLLMLPHRLALALQADGWWVRSDIVWAKGNPMPESVRDRPTRAHEYLFLLSKSPRYYYDSEAVREAGVCPAGTRGAKGSAARQAVPGVNARPPEYKVYDGQRNQRSVWAINSRPYKGAHFATFPPALVRPCIRAGTSERGCCPTCGAPWGRVVAKTAVQPKDYDGKWAGADPQSNGRRLLATVRGRRAAGEPHHNPFPGRQTKGWKPTCRCPEAEPVPCLVLDPFAGSGTVGEVAWQEGRRALLIELSPDYCGLIRERLEAAARRREPGRRGKRAGQQLSLPGVG